MLCRHPKAVGLAFVLSAMLGGSALAADAPAPDSAANTPERTFCRLDTSTFPQLPGEEVKEGFVDKDGAWAIPPVFTPSPYGDFGVSFEEGEPTQGLFFTAIIGDTYQVIHRNGHPFLLERLEGAFVFTEDRMRVTYKGHTLYYSSTGGLAFDRSFQRGSVFMNGLAAVTTDQGQSIIDRDGNEVLRLPRMDGTFALDGAALSSGGLNPFRRDDDVGLIDITGKEVVPPTYHFIGEFHEGRARARLSNGDGYLDETGAVVIPFEYEAAKDFSEQLAPVQRNQLWGYITPDGTLAIPHRYGWAEPFSDGLAYAADAERKAYGYINHAGEWAIPPRFERGEPFSHGIAIATLNGRKILIDQTGRDILAEDHGFTPAEAEITYCGTDLYRVTVPGKASYIADMRENRFVPVQTPPNRDDPTRAFLSHLYAADPALMMDYAYSLRNLQQYQWAAIFFSSIVTNFPDSVFAGIAKDNL